MLGKYRNRINVFPAHAGVIPAYAIIMLVEHGLPRACGGDPDRVKVYFLANASSPRMRG